MRRKRAPRRVRPPRPRGAVQAVVDETIALYHWLSWVADQLYGDDARGAARRWVLRALSRRGPQTVPELARVRAIRRQTLQPVVTALAADGLVVLAANPAHARSSLVALTPAGAALVARMDHVDERVLRSVGRGIDDHALATTTATLRAIRAGFESQGRWRAVAETSERPSSATSRRDRG